MWTLEAAHPSFQYLANCNIPYSRKIWRGIKFGSLAVLGEAAKLKYTKIYTECMYGDTVPDRRV